MAIQCQKSQFSLPSDIHYLNNATLGPLNIHSEQSGKEAMILGRNPLLRTRDQFFDPVERSRSLFGKLVNADPDYIAIIPSASYGLATVAKNIDLHQDDEIVVLQDQFPSNYYIWQHKCIKDGALLNIVSAPDSLTRSADWTAEILDSITPKTKIVAISNVHWMDGSYYDLKAIGKRCREHGTYLIIDGTQSVGALPFDVEEVKPDALIVAGYKWLLGSYGLGYAYYGPRLRSGEPLEINWINMEHSHDFENLTDYRNNYRSGAARYSMGEQSSFISIAMNNEALDLINTWGPTNIQSYAKSLTSDVWQSLQAAGIAIDNHKPSHHMTGLRFSNKWNMNQLQEALKAENIIVSRRGSALRVSVNIYNEAKDLEALAKVILSNRKL